jgi:hypothetical protein
LTFTKKNSIDRQVPYCPTVFFKVLAAGSIEPNQNRCLKRSVFQQQVCGEGSGHILILRQHRILPVKDETVGRDLSSLEKLPSVIAGHKQKTSQSSVTSGVITAAKRPRHTSLALNFQRALHVS